MRSSKKIVKLFFSRGQRMVVCGLAVLLALIPTLPLHAQETDHLIILDDTTPERRTSLKKDDQTREKIINDYIARCQTYMAGGLPDETTEEFCLCTGAQMSQSLTEGQILTLAYGEGAPVEETDFLVNVEAPCLYAPLGYIERNDCLYRGRYQNLFATYEIREMACQCLENEVRQYMQDVGTELVKFYIEDLGLPDDPIDDIPQHIEYRKFTDQARRNCIGEYR